MLKNVALFAAVFLLCLVVAEGVLRMLGYGNVEIYQADPHVVWRLKPNQNCYTKIGHKPVRINSHGTRGDEFKVPKPENTIRIVSLGDSRTFGWGLSNLETYSARLQERLQKRFGQEKRVEVINCGVNAWSYPQMTVFFREVARHWQPDWVILGEANLWTQFSEDTDPSFVVAMMKRVRIKNALRRFALYHFVVEVQLKNFYEQHRTRFVPVDPKKDELFVEQQKKDPGEFFRKAVVQFCRTAQSNQVQTLIVFIPMQSALLHSETNSFTDVLAGKRTASLECNVPLLDLTPDLRPQAKDLYLDADPVHLNAAGNEIIGRRLDETLAPLLKP